VTRNEEVLTMRLASDQPTPPTLCPPIIQPGADAPDAFVAH